MVLITFTIKTVFQNKWTLHLKITIKNACFELYTVSLYVHIFWQNQEKNSEFFPSSVIKSMWEFNCRLKQLNSNLRYPQMRIGISELKVIVTLCNPVLWKGRAELVTQREQSTVHRPNVGVNSGTSPLASLPTQRSFHPLQCHTIM